MGKFQHKPGADIIRILAREQYPSSLHSFREAIGNAFDEGSERIETVVDRAKAYISLEDWGGGISNVDKFMTYGQNLKADYDRKNHEVIGQKGLGKLSLLRLQDTVVFVSNCGTDNDVKLVMTPEDYDLTLGHPGQFLSHRGTKVIVENAYRSEIPNVSRLKEYLSEIFCLRIKKGAQIVVKDTVDAEGEALKPGKYIDPLEHHLFTLKGGVSVTGNIVVEESSKKKNIGWVSIFCQHVFVRSIEVDEIDPRKFTGWINFNNLTLTIGRDQIIENREYMDLMDHLRQYTKKFPKLEVDPDEITSSETQLTIQVENLVKNYMREMNIKLSQLVSAHQFERVSTASIGDEVTGKIIQGIGGTHIDPMGTVNPTGGTMQAIVRKPKMKRSKRVPGLEWQYGALGNDKDPLFFREPNIVYFNTGNDIYKIASAQGTGTYLGPMWFRLAPFLGRMFVKMKPESKSYSVDEMLGKIDEATRWVLKQHKLTRKILGEATT